MGNLFSSKKPKVTDEDRAVLTLKTQRRKLLAYQKQLDTVIARELEVARELLQQKRKERALLALKKKKAQEELVRKVDIWLLNVEQQLADVEIAGRQKALFESLKVGHQAIENLLKEVSVEDVQKLMEDSAEAKAYQDEIRQALGQQLTDEDEEAVLAELETLGFEMDLEDLPEPPQQVPEVPAVEATPERKQQEKLSGDPIVDSSDGLMALLVSSDRPAESQQNEDLEAEELDDEMDLPSVPTTKVRTQASEISKSGQPSSLKKAEEPLPA